MATAKKPTRSKSAKDKVAAKDAVVVEETVDSAAEIKQSEVNERKSPFAPMLLGGVLSGAIGFGAASYYFMNKPSDAAQALVQVQATLDDQRANLDDVGTEVSNLSGALDGLESTVSDKVSGLAQTVVQKDSELTDAIDGISKGIADFETRLTALEKRPIAEAGGMTGEAAAAYERELRTMRDLLETQRSSIEELAADATARIEGAAQQAATAEQAAENTAKLTTVRVAVSQLQSALDNGGAFEATIANLTEADVDIPPEIAEAAKGGVSTLLDLQESYPAAARAGLAASVKATTGDGTMDKLGSFFRSQVGARSLEPREGDDPDAVLSRAEAALGAGDTAGAILLIGALPQEGQAAMADWIGKANVRVKAVEAVRMLADSLNGN